LINIVADELPLSDIKPSFTIVVPNKIRTCYS